MCALTPPPHVSLTANSVEVFVASLTNPMSSSYSRFETLNRTMPDEVKWDELLIECLVDNDDAFRSLPNETKMEAVNAIRTAWDASTAVGSLIDDHLPTTTKKRKSSRSKSRAVLEFLKIVKNGIPFPTVHVDAETVRRFHDSLSPTEKREFYVRAILKSRYDLLTDVCQRDDFVVGEDEVKLVWSAITHFKKIADGNPTFRSDSFPDDESSRRKNVLRCMIRIADVPDLERVYTFLVADRAYGTSMCVTPDYARLTYVLMTKAVDHAVYAEYARDVLLHLVVTIREIGSYTPETKPLVCLMSYIVRTFVLVETPKLFQEIWSVTCAAAHDVDTMFHVVAMLDTHSFTKFFRYSHFLNLVSKIRDVEEIERRTKAYPSSGTYPPFADPTLGPCTRILGVCVLHLQERRGARPDALRRNVVEASYGIKSGFAVPFLTEFLLRRSIGYEDDVRAVLDVDFLKTDEENDDFVKLVVRFYPKRAQTIRKVTHAFALAYPELASWVYYEDDVDLDDVVRITTAHKGTPVTDVARWMLAGSSTSNRPRVKGSPPALVEPVAIEYLTRSKDAADGTCRVCNKNFPDVCFDRCSHVSVCSTCSPIVIACPMCSKTSRTRTKLDYRRWCAYCGTKRPVMRNATCDHVVVCAGCFGQCKGRCPICDRVCNVWYKIDS